MNAREDRNYVAIVKALHDKGCLVFDVHGRPPCLECHKPLGSDECANERGEPSGVHADCWAAYCAGLRSEDEDRRVDRAQERDMFREWGSRS